MTGRGRLLAAFDRIWEGTFGSTEILRIDPRSNTVEARLDRGEPTAALTAGFGAVWACGPASVSRIDPMSMAVMASTDERCQFGVTTGFGSVWLAQFGRVVRLDPDTLAIQARIEINGGGWGIATGHDAIWVADGRGPSNGNTVTRIDPATNTVGAEIPVGGRCRHLLATDDRIWVTIEPRPPELVGLGLVNPSTNAVTSTVGGFPVDATGIVSSGRYLMISSYYGPVAVVDPATAHVVATFEPRQPGPEGGRDGIADAAGALWLVISNTDYDLHGAVIRIDPGPYA